MAMSLGSNSQKAEINVTPMIDVLLVLIIIFMVITPLMPRGLKALVPQAAAAPIAAPAHDIVISVLHNQTFALNRERLDLESLRARLVRLFASGANDVVFVRGEKDLEFRQIAQVIDLAKGAGVRRVGLMTK